MITGETATHSGRMDQRPASHAASKPGFPVKHLAWNGTKA
jgi:hypothetical protein